MNSSKQVKKLCLITAIGAASVLTSNAVNAATIGFAEGPLIDITSGTGVTSNSGVWTGVGTTFTLNLVATGLIGQTYGGGIGISFDQSLVNITGATIDPFWQINEQFITNSTGNYEMNGAQFGFSTVNEVSQGIVSIDFTVVGLGEFDFGLYSTGAVGDWAYTPPLTAVATNDLTYCMVNSVSDTTCLDSKPILADTGRELLVLNTSHVVVPVPAAAWLFGSGLIGLVAVSRRKTV